MHTGGFLYQPNFSHAFSYELFQSIDEEVIETLFIIDVSTLERLGQQFVRVLRRGLLGG